MPSYTDASLNCSELQSVYHNEMALLHVVAAMQERGVLVNTEYVREALAYEHKEIEAAKKDFQIETGTAYQDSPKLFKEIFDARGEKYGKTAKGNASFTADVLEEIDTPTAKLINRIRHHEKRAGTYWSSFLLYADESGILRANAGPANTITGRFSYRNPNLQNLPSEEDSKSPFVIRGSFIPHPNSVWVSIDYQAIEYRIFLDMAGEKNLIDKVNQGFDLHQATAEMMGVDRYTAKTIGFMLLYGGGVKKLAASLGITEAEAKRLRDLYFSRLPKVRRLMSEIINRAESRGYIYNFLGRRFWLNNFTYSYKMPNALIQGTAADILKLAMVNIFKARLEGVELLLTIHDELDFCVSPNNLDQIIKIKEIMQSVYAPLNGLPMVAEASVSGKSLAKQDLVKFNG